MNDHLGALDLPLTRWDVVIAGAGPAGALLGYLLARRNWRVLIADRSAFPRDKVCGGCLNGRALAALESAGLGGLPRKHGSAPLERFRLSTGRAGAELPLPAGEAISRRALDAALAQSAVDAGAAFVTKTRVKAGPAREGARPIALRRSKDEMEVQAHCFVDAASCLKNDMLAHRVWNKLSIFPNGLSVLIITERVVPVTSRIRPEVCFPLFNSITACGKFGPF